jgi:hypothetical protein
VGAAEACDRLVNHSAVRTRVVLLGDQAGCGGGAGADFLDGGALLGSRRSNPRGWNERLLPSLCGGPLLVH